MRIKEFFGRYFATRACAGCGRMLSYDYAHQAFCDACREKWEKAKTEECPTCLQAISECCCMPPCMAKEGVLTLRRMVHYHAEDTQDAGRNAILYLKDHRIPRIAAFFGKQLAYAVTEELGVLGCGTSDAVIVFVPRSKRAVIRHGFDQAQMIAEGLAQAVGAECVSLLCRTGRGKEQKKLNATQRQQNAKKQFALTKDAQAYISGKCVILVDDIVTTGSGMAACAALLRKAGADRVLALSVATVADRRKRKETK